MTFGIKDDWEKIRQFPLWIISAHILSRFLLGVGTGILLVFLFKLELLDAFIFVILAVLVSVPSTYKMMEMRLKERKKKK